MATVLCIDDQEVSVSIRKMFLEAQGYSVLIATNGRSGLELLAAHPVDALILDYRMPGMDGEEVAREARRLYPQLPIIMLSGYVAEFPEALQAAANACVVKGAPPEELLGALERLVGPQSKTPGVNAVEDLVTTGREQVTRARERVAANLKLLKERRSRPRK